MSPMSVDMSAWAAMGDTTSRTASGPGSQGLLPDMASTVEAALSGKPDEPAETDSRPRAESQLGSIAAWQAIAADVSALLTQGPVSGQLTKSTVYPCWMPCYDVLLAREERCAWKVFCLRCIH